MQLKLKNKLSIVMGFQVNLVNHPLYKKAQTKNFYFRLK